MLLKDYLSSVVKKHSLNLTISNVLHLWKLIIFTHFLEFPNILQPAFVMIPDFNSIELISSRINQTVDSVMHFLIFKGHCVALESSPCIVI